MPGEFDMDAAVESIAEGLGFDEPSEVVEQSLPEAAPVADSVETPPEAEPAPAITLPEVPKTWRQQAAAHWTALPDEVRAEVLKREQDIFQGLEQYRSDAQFGKPYRDALTPYLPLLQQHNIDPVRQVTSLLEAHKTLALGSPEDRLAMFQQLASDYQIPLDQLGTAPFVDPTVSMLQRELSTIKSTLSNAERQRQEAALAEQRAAVDAFGKDPANTHFQEVANDMARLISSGVCKDLKTAYEQAVWASPILREKEIARIHAEKTKAGLEAAAKQAQAARKAASAHVTSKPRVGGGTIPAKTMDETMDEVMRKFAS